MGPLLTWGADSFCLSAPPTGLSQWSRLTLIPRRCSPGEGAHLPTDGATACHLTFLRPAYERPVWGSIFLPTVGASDVFYFFCSDREKGESEAPGEGLGGRFLWKIPGGGGLQEEEGLRGGRVSAANWGIFGGGGGLIFFVRGRNVHQVTYRWSFFAYS